MRDRAYMGFDSIMALLQWGERSKAESERRDLARLAAETRHHDALIMSSAVEALFAMLDGRLHEAVEKSMAGEFGTATHAWRGRMASWLGQAGVLDSEITWAKGFTRSSFQPIFTAFFLAHAGRSDEAQAVSADLPLLRPERSKLGSYGLQLLILEAAAISRDKKSAPVLRDLVRGDTRCLATLPFVLVPRHLGGLAALMGDFESAKADYRRAIDFCESIGYRPELALTRFDLAQLLLAHYPAERAEAIGHLDFAIAEFEAMGMQPALQRALRLRGRRRASRPRLSAHPDGLTDREVDLLRLIAQGRSNKEMADELALSIRTVERHISNAYLKTDTHGRAQATAYAIAHGLT